MPKFSFTVEVVEMVVLLNWLAERRFEIELSLSKRLGDAFKIKQMRVRLQIFLLVLIAESPSNG